MKIKRLIARIMLGLCCVTGVAATSLVLASCDNTEVTEQKFTVTFNSKGGNDLDPVEVVSGNTITKPQNPTRSGYNFKYWSLTDGGSEYDFATPVTGNITLYAVWEVAETPVTKYTVTFNSTGGSAVSSVEVESGKTVSKPQDPTQDGKVFKHWSLTEGGEAYDFATPVNGNITLYAVWEAAQTPVTNHTVTFDAKGGISSITTLEVEDGKTLVAPPAPTKDGFTFKHWSLTDGGEAYDFATPVTANITLYAVWVETEVVNRTLDLTTPPSFMTQDPSSPNNYLGNGTIGSFTLYGNKLRYEVNNKAINTQGSADVEDNSIAFTTTSAGTLSFNIKNASSSNPGLVLLDSEGNQVAKEVLVANQELTGSFNIPAAGTYYFGGETGSVRVFALSYTETVEKSDPKAIEVSTLPNVNFLEGREFSTAGINVTLVYENGRTDVLSADSYTVTPLTAEQMATPGVYQVKVQATVEGVAFETSYEVTVYDLDRISFSLLDYQNKTNVYTQQIFLVGDTFNYNNLVVVAHGVYNDKTYDFVLSADEYAVKAPDLATAGNKSVLITSNTDNTKTAEYVVDVVTNVFADATESVDVDVTLNVTTNVSAEQVEFGSINLALQYLALCKLPDNIAINILVGEGTFKEKVEVTLPNVHIYGKDTAEAHDKTVIVYGAYNGLTVPNGTTNYSTDGSATFTVSSTAINFSAENITFANEINTLEEYQAVPSSDKQAVAVMVEADSAIFRNVKFTGYQDTLYARNGRQYYENCYIEGRTDYIFGEDATAVFEKCVIHSFGANNDVKNGGYIVATKGVEALNYGYIFDNCNFTAADDVTPGTVSLARGWDDYMTMLVMNSNIGGHISKEAYLEVTAGSEDNKNDRYGKMNAEPDASRLLEYNNTGDGAISESLANTCTVLDAEAAKKFLTDDNKLDLVEVYGKDTNGLNYAYDWTAGKVEPNATIKYYNGEELMHTQYDYVGTTLDSLWSPKSQEGLTFTGWYTTPTFDEGTEYDQTKALAATTNLYGKFEASGEQQTYTHVYSSNDLTIATYTENLTWGTDGIVTILATSSKNVVIDANSKKYDDNHSYDNRIKFGGTMNDTGRALQIDLTKYSAGAQITIDVYAMSGSKDAIRPMVLNNAEHEEITRQDVAGDKLYKTTFTLTGGQIVYIGSGSSGMNFYGLEITVID